MVESEAAGRQRARRLLTAQWLRAVRRRVERGAAECWSECRCCCALDCVLKCDWMSALGEWRLVGQMSRSISRLNRTDDHSFGRLTD